MGAGAQLVRCLSTNNATRRCGYFLMSVSPLLSIPAHDREVSERIEEPPWCSLPLLSVVVMMMMMMMIIIIVVIIITICGDHSSFRNPHISLICQV